jgi:GntR family transcriptional repressor for pyruvate dehydrogenase complex
MFLTPVARTTLTADICRKMVAHLMRGDWSAGERIPPERELCLQLGVGRASLREALKALEIMGMIETRLGDGTFVCPRSDFFSRPLMWAIAGSNQEDTIELVEARKLIELELVRLAALRATADDLKAIGAHLDAMEESTKDSKRFQEEDVNFHLAVGTAAHNRILLNAFHLIRNLMHQWIATAVARDGVVEKALDQHRKIFMAIAKRNPETAQAAMEKHLDSMAEYLFEQENSETAAAPVGTAESS